MEKRQIEMRPFNKNTRMHHIAIFASGTGSNAKKIVEYFKGHREIKVSLVVSNKKNAPVLEMAKSNNIPTLTIDREQFYNSEDILKKIDIYQIDFIVLAGFLLLVPKYLIRKFDKRIINIHPALLPKYGGKGMYGMNVHKAVKAANEAASGITIHYVNEKFDEGEILFQQSCKIIPEDSPETIAQKVLQLEHQHYSKVIENILTKEA
jgi:phosphoribosylglycinamide formyltransferase-1